MHLTSTRCREYCSPKLVVLGSVLPRPKAGRGDRPGMQVGPRTLTIPSLDSAQVSSSAANFGQGFRQICDPEAHTVSQRTRHLRAEGWQLGQRSHRQDDDISVVPFQVSAALRRGVARLSCPSGFRHRKYFLGGTRLCGGAGQKISRGLFSCRRYAGRRRGPHNLCSRK